MAGTRTRKLASDRNPRGLVVIRHYQPDPVAQLRALVLLLKAPVPSYMENDESSPTSDGGAVDKAARGDPDPGVAKERLPAPR